VRSETFSIITSAAEEGVLYVSLVHITVRRNSQLGRRRTYLAKMHKFPIRSPRTSKTPAQS
jgi:hypothetical protein